MTEQQRALIAEEVLSGRETAARMARRYKVSEATVSRAMAAYRTMADAPEGSLPRAEDAGESRTIAGVLPLSVLDERLAIVGTSGSGKTYAAKGLVERLMDQGARVCIVDPLGVWWGLRQGADGAASPSPHPVVVFGGSHADVALDEGSSPVTEPPAAHTTAAASRSDRRRAAMGATLGHVVGTHAMACVVDVSDLGSAAARRSFMTAFMQALYAANTEPLHLVLDEADLWAPQRVQPDGYALLNRVEEIVRRGRVRGFVPWLITQRPAVLHKDVLSQADVLVSMKLTASQDRDAVGRWIEGQADRAEGGRILAALPRLGLGEGWVWAPSLGVLAQVAFPRIRSFDSSRTPPRPERVAPPRGLAAVDLAAIRRRLAGAGTGATTAGAHGDPAAGGRGQVSELERQLRHQTGELAAARARVAALEAEAAVMQAQLAPAEERCVYAAPAASAPTPVLAQPGSKVACQRRGAGVPSTSLDHDGAGPTLEAEHGARDGVP